MGMVDEAKGNWLCPSALDRERLVDMHERVAIARRIQGIAVGCASVVASACLGWWLLGLVALALGVLLWLERAFKVTRHPEWVSVGSLVGMGAVSRQAHWRKAGEVLLAWVSTVPCGAVMAAVAYSLITRL